MKPREIARQLVSKRLQIFCGFGIDDVPDTPEINSIVDDVEGMLEGGSRTSVINEFINESINEDTIEELIL